MSEEKEEYQTATRTRHKVIDSLLSLLVEIDTIHPDPSNAREGHDVEGIAASLNKYGQRTPLVANSDGTVEKGNGTLAAAKSLGWTHVAAARVDDEPVVATGYALADNALGDASSFNLERLKALTDSIPKAEELPGFDLERLEEIRAMCDGDEVSDVEDVEPQVDKAAELQKQWGTELGQLWELGSHKLVCGDCTDNAVVERVMGGERADMLFTDPPYGVKRDKGFDGFGGFGPPIARRQYSDVWDASRPAQETFDLHLGVADKAIIFGGNFFADILPRSTHWIVWDKLNTMPTFGDCELAWTNLERKSVKKITFEYNGLIGKEKERFHPTQKPLGLYIEILEMYTTAGETAIDFYLGSGTTLIACERLNRKCRAVEIEPKYVAVALQRWADATGKTPKLIEND